MTSRSSAMPPVPRIARRRRPALDLVGRERRADDHRRHVATRLVAQVGSIVEPPRPARAPPGRGTPRGLRFGQPIEVLVDAPPTTTSAPLRRRAISGSTAPVAGPEVVDVDHGGDLTSGMRSLANVAGSPGPAVDGQHDRLMPAAATASRIGAAVVAPASTSERSASVDSRPGSRHRRDLVPLGAQYARRPRPGPRAEPECVYAARRSAEVSSSSSFVVTSGYPARPAIRATTREGRERRALPPLSGHSEQLYGGLTCRAARRSS